MQPTITLTLKGKTLRDLATEMRACLTAIEGNIGIDATGGQKTVTFNKPATKGKTETTAAETTDDVAAETAATTTADEVLATVTRDMIRKECAKYVKTLVKKGKSADEARQKIQSVFKKKFGVALVDQLKEDQLSAAFSSIQGNE